MSAGAWVVVAAVVAALAFGTYRLLTDGRFRGKSVVEPGSPVVEPVPPVVEPVETPSAGSPVVEPVPPVVELVETPWAHVSAAVPDAEPGERATLLQFSSAFCAPCRATRRTLADVADLVPGVTHVEVDAEHHLELVRTLGIMRTPTTLVLDGLGREVTRATGAPRREQVLNALGWA
ncbi:MAG: thioredoxin family protein [Nocardioides sp.]